MNDLYRISFVFVFDSSSKDLEDSSSKDLEWAKKGSPQAMRLGTQRSAGVIKFDLRTARRPGTAPAVGGPPTSYEDSA